MVVGAVAGAIDPPRPHEALPVSMIRGAVAGLMIIPLLALYFLPWILARRREHNQTRAIAVLNTFLGWTLLGWVAALVWSQMNEPAER